MNSGVVFKWLKHNQNEIRNHRQNNGKTPNLQAYVNKLHLKYIATRIGAALNKNAHGMFGYIYEPEKKKLLDCDELKLEDISKRVGNMSKEGIDVFKTVISLKEEDAIEYGYTTRSAWKGLLELKINTIAKEYKIPVTDLEWTASYHAEAGHLHCHLLFWDRNQYDEKKDNSKMPYVAYKKIRKELTKEVFKSDYKKAILVKNVAKKNIEKLSSENINAFYKEIRERYKNKIFEFNFVETFKEEQLIHKIKNNLEVNQKVFLYDKTNPQNFVEIKKVYPRKWNRNQRSMIEDTSKEPILQFRNNGSNTLLYKPNDELESACFMANFENIGQVDSLEELEEIISKHKKIDENLNNILMEISPENMPQNIFSHQLRKKEMSVIVDMMAGLETYIKQENKNALGTEKVNYRYGYQQNSVKKYIDKISVMILKASPDCKLAFQTYIRNYTDVQRTIGDIENDRDEKNIKRVARDEFFNKMGNCILKMIKEIKKEETQEQMQLEQLKWKMKKEEYELKQYEWDLKYQQIQENMTRKMIEDIFRDLSNMSNSSIARATRIKKEYGSFSKAAKKELAILKANSDGIEWFIE